MKKQLTKDEIERRKVRKREQVKAWSAANPERKRASTKAWQDAHPDEMRAHRKAYLEANREKVREQKKAYREANREEIRIKRRARYEANREKVLAYQKAYAAAHPKNPEQAEAHREVVRAYYAANREKVKAKAKAHYVANRDEIRIKEKADGPSKRAKQYASQKASRERLRERLRQAMIATGLDTNSMNQFPRFPIWGTSESIPWAVIEPHRAQAFKNTAMSLTMLAQRGGLEWSELLAVLNDRPHRRVPEDEARRQVEEIIASRFQSQPPVAL